MHLRETDSGLVSFDHQSDYVSEGLNEAEYEDKWYEDNTPSHMPKTESILALVKKLHSYAREQPAPNERLGRSVSKRVYKIQNLLPVRLRWDCHRKSFVPKDNQNVDNPTKPQAPSTITVGKPSRKIVTIQPVTPVPRKPRTRRKSTSKRGRKKKFSTNSDSETEESAFKRTQHNRLERFRRKDMAETFTMLKNVTHLKHRDWAPKILIINTAIDYIDELKQTEERLVDELKEHVRYNNFLMEKVCQLKKDIVNMVKK